MFVGENAMANKGLRRVWEVCEPHPDLDIMRLEQYVWSASSLSAVHFARLNLETTRLGQGVWSA
ncbi:MAG: hypothetical protein NZM42_10830, partial [Gemmatales bacterium]|nr:hypothetical protein [Gemmatales bacterium]